VTKTSVWVNPQLRRLILAGIPADFADWLDYVAIVALLAYTWQSGPWSLALLAIALGLPYLMVGPIAGALVDKSDLRTVLIISNLGRSVTTAALIFVPDVAVLLIVVFVRGAIDSAFTPARQAAIQVLAKEQQRNQVNSIVHGINQLSKIAGPALGGALLAVVTPQWVFAINACTSLLAALIIWGIKIPHRDSSEHSVDEKMLARVLAGFAEVKNNSKLAMGIAFVAVSLFAVFLYDTFIVLLAVGFGFDAAIYGLSIAAVGAGGIAGALLVAKWGTGEKHLVIMSAGSLASGLIVVVGSLFSIFDKSLPVGVFLAGFFAVGVCTALVQIPYRSLLQREAPADKMARVVASGEAISVIAMLGAPLLGGFLVARFSVGMPFAVGGTMMVLVGIAGALSSSR